MVRVMDIRAVCGAGGVEDAAWGATEVVGAARETAEVGKAHNEGVAQGLAVVPLVVAVGPPASVWGAV
jgi:hypothetical protein